MAVAQKVGCDLMRTLDGMRKRKAGLRHRSLVLAALGCAFFGGLAQAETFYLTVAGLGGEQEYEQRFDGWAKELDKILKSEPNSKVETLSGPQATKANLQAKLAAIAQQSKPDDAFVLFLIGHGSFDESDYKFNIPGPDVSATELGNALDKIQARQLIVNMTSASGGSLPIIQKPKRVVIVATKGGTEKNATVFARYWIEALRDPAADADKNEIITALEAYRYVETKVAKFFTDLGRLATEHPLLEDAGKGEGAKTFTTENGEGLVAGRFAVLHTGSAVTMAKDPAKQQLLKQKEDIEQKIDELKYRKASMPVQEYRQQLSKFLVDLAKVQAALDK
jgi:hypothetical protein